MSQEIKTINNIEDNAGHTDSAWKSLYKTGGVAALIATGLFLSDIIVLTTGGSMPGSAQDWFTLLQNNKVAGLLQLFFTDLIGVALMAPIIFALYAALRGTNPAYSALATALAFIGIALVFATNTNYSLIYLNNQYVAATTEVHRSQLLAAAEATLAAGMGGTGLLMAGLFLEGALLMISVIMLQGFIFGKRIAYLGILAHGLDLAHTIVFLIFIPVFNTDVALAIGTPLLAIGGTLQLIWYPLVARRLLQLGQQTIPL
jgi:hypothetical protein